MKRVKKFVAYFREEFADNYSSLLVGHLFAEADEIADRDGKVENGDEAGAEDEEQQKYYFAIADIVQVLTDSVNPRDYIKKMLRRDPELKSKWGTICPPVEMLAPDGKLRKTQASDLKGIFRIIESSPSKKAEPIT